MEIRIKNKHLMVDAKEISTTEADSKNDDAYRSINVYLCAMATINAMDSIEGLAYYRMDVKRDGKQFLKSLEKVTERATRDLWGVDDPVLYDCMSNSEGIMQELAHVVPYDMGELLQVIKMFREDPERVMELLGIKSK